MMRLAETDAKIKHATKYGINTNKEILYLKRQAESFMFVISEF